MHSEQARVATFLQHPTSELATTQPRRAEPPVQKSVPECTCDTSSDNRSHLTPHEQTEVRSPLHVRLELCPPLKCPKAPRQATERAPVARNSTPCRCVSRPANPEACPRALHRLLAHLHWRPKAPPPTNTLQRCRCNPPVRPRKDPALTPLQAPKRKEPRSCLPDKCKHSPAYTDRAATRR
jgi:hypothetical protein